MNYHLTINRKLKQYRFLLLFLGLFLSWGFYSSPVLALSSETEASKVSIARSNHSIEVDGKKRKYILSVPTTYKKDKSYPLVFSFHGGGGRVEKTADYYALDPLAETREFIVVYPLAYKRHWNDGRVSKKFKKYDSKIDDVAFVKALMKLLKQRWSIDDRRVYAMGISNGGIFSQRLATEMSGQFAAVASVASQLAVDLEPSFSPEAPISVMLMNGTMDPFVPYAGGEVTPYLNKKVGGLWRKTRGKVMPTDKNISLWLKHNDLLDLNPVLTLIDNDKNDDTQVESSVWQKKDKGVSVVLYRVLNGGHTLPGTKQYLTDGIVGKTSQDINGIALIVDFFLEHPKP